MIKRFAIALGLAFLLSGCKGLPDKNEELTEIFQSKAVLFEESGSVSFKVWTYQKTYKLCRITIDSIFCIDDEVFSFDAQGVLKQIRGSRVLYVDGKVEILTPPEVKTAPLHKVVPEFELLIDRWIDYSICEVNHSGEWRPEDVELAKKGKAPNTERCNEGRQK